MSETHRESEPERDERLGADGTPAPPQAAFEPRAGAAPEADQPDDGDYAELELEDETSVVPAAGGTFGVEDDHSGFGTGDFADSTPAVRHEEALAANEVPAAWPQQPQPDAAAPETVDEVVREGNRQVPASGGTFGVTVDESGYEGAPGRPNAGPSGVSKFGVPPSAKSGFEGYAPGAEGREFAAPQFGTTTDTTEEPAGFTPMIALGLAVIALVILCLPGWAWIVGGIVGVVALVLGAVSMRGPRRSMAMLGAVGGALAVLIAIATAVFVFFI